MCLEIIWLKPKRIVITGGPGTGKTSVIKNLEESGYLCFHEIIRDLTSEAIHGNDPSNYTTNPLQFVDDPFLFNTRILKGRLQQFLEAKELEKQVVFFDRGIPDVLAYMDYFGQEYGEDFIDTCRINRYDQVVILPPWKEIYKSDGERFESFDEARAIHEELVKTYEFFEYAPVTLPTGTVDERSQFVKNLFN